ncbi:MAG: hypothetical protein LZ168_04765, partial [Thaumarchaeota archaeon]|nr:hypothetical protein [Candidatus Geocrenenecus arthurdayi]
WKLLEGDDGVTPVSDTIILLMVVKIFGKVSMSRLHKIVYILKYKYGVPLSLRYERPYLSTLTT